MEELYLKDTLEGALGKDTAAAWWANFNTALNATPLEILNGEDGVAIIEGYLVDRQMLSRTVADGKVTLDRLIAGQGLRKEDALILIDIQNDFMEGGALGVAGSPAILPIVSELAYAFDNVILTQDWHPADHLSFASSHQADPFTQINMPYGPQVLWPSHCVMGSEGAEFSLPTQVVTASQAIIRKGFRKEIDSYSAFCENDGVTQTGLAGMLKDRGISRVYFAGLALDYCVAFSAIDAVKAGFEAIVILPACRGIDPDEQKTIKRLEDAGVHILR